MRPRANCCTRCTATRTGCARLNSTRPARSWSQEATTEPSKSGTSGTARCSGRSTVMAIVFSGSPGRRRVMSSAAVQPTTSFVCGTRGRGSATSGRTRLTMEGHTGGVTAVSFSHDSALLASKANDNTVRFWRADTGEEVAVIAESASGNWFSGIAFHPTEPALATLAERNTVIRVWHVDRDRLLGDVRRRRGRSDT